MATLLTGPVLLPGDDDPVVGAQVRVKLVAGGARTPGHVNGAARQGEWTTETDEAGQFSVSVDTLPEDDTVDFPSSSYYLVTVGGGSKPVYAVKVKPIIDGTYCFTDPAIRVFTDVPPDVVFATPQASAELVAAGVETYLTGHPIDVDAEVAAALADNPPLYPAQNLADVADAATALGNLNGADATTTQAALDAIHADLDPVVLAESADPSLRTSDLGDTVAPLASPALTGDPTVPTQTAGNSSTRAASTAFVGTAVANEATARDTAIGVETTRATAAEALLAPKASPALTGTPSVPTAAQGTNTTQAASTAFVQTEVGLLVPKSVLTTDGDILTRSGGVPARITRSSLAADSAFTSAFVAAGDARLTDTRTPTDGSVTNAKVATSAAIATSKIAQDQGVTGGLSGHIATGTITNANVSSSAAIAYSKLNLTGAVLNADLAGSIAYSKLSLTGAILNADLAGSIALSKLATQTTGTFVGNGSGSTAAPTAMSAATARAQLGTGTPDASTFLRGDGAWVSNTVGGQELGYSEVTTTKSSTNTSVITADPISGLSVTVTGTGRPVEVRFSCALVTHSVANNWVNVGIIKNGVTARTCEVVPLGSGAGPGIEFSWRGVLTASTSYTFTVGLQTQASTASLNANSTTAPMYLSVVER